jgi:hypothetical protein
MQTFPIAAATVGTKWIFLILPLLILGGVMLLLGRSLSASHNARFDVSPAGLQLHGDWYGRTIPADAIQRNHVRRVDFSSNPELTPRTRTMGTGLPGYQGGWFRLRNGERALLYLTDRNRAVYIPTTAGYSVLVSPADPDGFLSAIRAIGR